MIALRLYADDKVEKGKAFFSFMEQTTFSRWGEGTIGGESNTAVKPLMKVLFFNIWVKFSFSGQISLPKPWPLDWPINFTSLVFVLSELKIGIISHYKMQFTVNIPYLQIIYLKVFRVKRKIDLEFPCYEKNVLFFFLKWFTLYVPYYEIILKY